MTLRVEFDQFAPTVQRVLGGAPVYVTRLGRGVLVTAARPEADALVVARAPMALDDARKRLSDAGLEVFDGQWSMDWSAERGAGGAFVAAIAYISGSGKPGLWMDACPDEPTPAQMLKAMHAEMTTNGEVVDVPFEDFIQAASPNVLILGPSEIEHFMRDGKPE